ncbi:transcription initiation factor TFIIB [Halogranum amylolyticum]|uniref:Transcription initiation factor TFIIB n=1 Tax=Halogranum amylolyticum TaxID=660520 RepID=A0A1H8MS12_9EURY|nr:hypothetical protein [Halogranum amylolyticum]SEO20028.1 transcription initiation factor TFIIB [Halogranum amylolyticum]
MKDYSNIGEEDLERQTTDRTNECPECAGRLGVSGIETICGECGLVVRTDAVDCGVSPSAHKQLDGSGRQEWAIEPTTAFRVDKGLHTTFFLRSDGYGNQLSGTQLSRWRWLRRLDRRMAKRDARLNEALRDVQTIGGNLGLPGYVREEACALMRVASEKRLPGGWMAWESLAGGAVLLAARRVGLPIGSENVAMFAKTDHERLCAAARKIRIEGGLVEQYPPVRTGAVDAVLAGLGDVVDVRTLLEFAQIGRYLLWMADDEPVGGGTARLTVAAAAVYAADRLTPGKSLTQAQVVAAARPVCATSKSKVAQYSQALYNTYETRHGRVAPTTVLEAKRDTVAVR